MRFSGSNLILKKQGITAVKVSTDTFRTMQVRRELTNLQQKTEFSFYKASQEMSTIMADVSKNGSSSSETPKTSEWRKIIFPPADNGNSTGTTVKIGQRLGLPFVRSLQPSIKIKLPEHNHQGENVKFFETDIFQDGTGTIGISGVVWDCGLYLVDYLISQYFTHNNLFPYKTVLDVGCGTGIGGISSLHLGAEYVTFTDLFFIESLENNLDQLPESVRRKASFIAYQWGNQPIPEGLNYPLIVEGSVEDNAHPKWDLIICSDLLYESKNHSSLLSFLNQLSYQMIIFSYKKRHDKEEMLFFEQLSENHSLSVVDPEEVPSCNIPKESVHHGLYLIVARRK
jgi:predicted nicotinamide N-methyase